MQYENEDSIVRCFHWINLEGDGVITEEELVKAFVEYEDRPEKKAKQEAAEIMSKIDFNQSKDIDYSGKNQNIQNFWWHRRRSKRL